MILDTLADVINTLKRERVDSRITLMTLFSIKRMLCAIQVGLRHALVI